MKVSIITVSFNSKVFISQAMESVISQGYKDIEHIVIDGGSTDGTVDVIKNTKIRYLIG
jgi:glycosyltransferase involved in cell wall biosynthesis